MNEDNLFDTVQWQLIFLFFDIFHKQVAQQYHLRDNVQVVPDVGQVDKDFFPALKLNKDFVPLSEATRWSDMVSRNWILSCFYIQLTGSIGSMYNWSLPHVIGKYYLQVGQGIVLSLDHYTSESSSTLYVTVWAKE